MGRTVTRTVGTRVVERTFGALQLAAIGMATAFWMTALVVTSIPKLCEIGRHGVRVDNPLPDIIRSWFDGLDIEEAIE